MDRNFLLAIVLSIVIIVAFQFYHQSVAPPPPKKPPVTTEAEKEPLPVPQALKAPEKAPEAVMEPKKTQPQAEIKVPEVPETRTRIETPNFEALLTSKGGKIVSFKLKNYTVSVQGTELVDLFDAGGKDTSGPSIMFTRRDETFSDSALSYQTDAQPTVKLRDGQGKTSISYRATTETGLTITKTYTFDSDTYEVGFSVLLANGSNEDRNYLITFPLQKYYPPEENERFAWNSAEILINGSLKDYYFKDIKGDEELSGQVEWSGLGDAYFFKSLVFKNKPANKVTLFKPVDSVAEIWARFGAVDIPAGQSVNTALALYLGPKQQQALTAAGDNLSKALFYSNYKILDIMAEYLIAFLRLSHSGFTIAGIRIPGTGNYGIDIIILTIIIKILFIPLTHKSMKSMKRMQDIQPQIQKLRDKYKDDKAAINKATMELFREQKVNPLGGCWPMFLQLPVFIALYQALSYAIELRHAHFTCIPSIYLCINDLSAPDPYYVTPILMGGTMVLQQWMTPSGGDPTQKKMMLLMPVVFTYLFLSFPSGLVLYWLVSNVLSIAQQIITNKMAD
ncbi:membrane protein insertase YidC [Desulfomonile tiedjei]|uniref:Membrane protein insertase YidC n=1 Tax=Desulfomonile tiedjei (strain ATCC 49306 / DSM 6799 / DCB-1) TaxID=706587 RepID=I4CAI8_DESTA|nr:membrane protein insertase YidC [Desulfomonile tiedjei]AFM26579.1 protein translocase subunit yidC [Desulfomonile tiedjei DSM 6799]